MMGTESQHHLKLNTSTLVMKTAASFYFWSNTSGVEGKATSWRMTREHPKKPNPNKKPHGNPNQNQTQFMGW